MIRQPGCRACEQLTSGDCGAHVRPTVYGDTERDNDLRAELAALRADLLRAREARVGSVAELAATIEAHRTARAMLAAAGCSCPDAPSAALAAHAAGCPAMEGSRLRSELAHYRDRARQAEAERDAARAALDCGLTDADWEAGQRCRRDGGCAACDERTYDERIAAAVELARQALAAAEAQARADGLRALADDAERLPTAPDAEPGTGTGTP